MQYQREPQWMQRTHVKETSTELELKLVHHDVYVFENLSNPYLQILAHFAKPKFPDLARNYEED